ncbi:MAG: GNAT family N-acetyltransferase [Lachnospiraceae bacterium]|nr:GNAT family N-acetyltransferase [Lachnospiraceae bacterium]
MRLRKLELKDAPLMLEWMHDDSVVHDLNRDFSAYTVKNCEDFINMSLSGNDIHMAIVDDEDTYMGTVSLKNIDHNEKTAEFGIAVRTAAMHKGYSAFAMREIFDIAAENGLKRIFWCVSPGNRRALRFYDKNGYERAAYSRINVETDYPEDKINTFVWYLHSLD